MKENKIIEPCKAKYFWEIYETHRVKANYYLLRESRIRAFCIALRNAFWMLILAFRILMRISSSID